ncbi:helix-turn-helix domain-containing protein [Kordia sp.]|uniref:helix-turn-helix domain-containing protein n=1 Tax=Kordia sp. TaxID=1965332 RepID=UPI003D6A5D02
MTEYTEQLSKSQDSALLFCNELINSEKHIKKASGLAGKAYVYTLKSDFDVADTLFKESLLQLSQANPKEIEIEAYILYLQSLRYIETHELEIALQILHKAIRLCDTNCSFLLEINLQSALGRTYSLSNKVFKALEISNLSLKKIKNESNYLNSNSLKTQYVKELVKAASRSMNIYHYKEKSSYIDSTQTYITLAKKYADEYQISNYNSYITLINADIHLKKREYKIAKEYYKEGLKIFNDQKYKKRIAQLLFRIAECDFYLKNYDTAETVFLKQINDGIWSEFQLLTNEALSFFYLFKIYEAKKQPKKALAYANKYAEKIRTHFEAKSESNASVHDLITHEKNKKEVETYLQNYQSQKKQKNIYLYLLLASIAFISAFITYFFQTKRKNKRNISLLNSRIEQLQQNVSKQNTSTSSVGLTDENALKLITKLKRLEKEQLFLHPNYTLAMMAKKLNTNSSYLSKTVNNYLNLTFAEYSNRLRIHSIVLKLKEQKNLRNYTIEALAKEAGYKSVTSFNTNFKKLLKVTPSQYLRELKRDK